MFPPVRSRRTFVRRAAASGAPSVDPLSAMTTCGRAFGRLRRACPGILRDARRANRSPSPRPAVELTRATSVAGEVRLRHRCTPGPHAAPRATAATGSDPHVAHAAADEHRVGRSRGGPHELRARRRAVPVPGPRLRRRTPRVRGRTSWPARSWWHAGPPPDVASRPASSSRPSARSPANGRRADLVVHDVDRVALALEPQHGGHEVGADPGVHPCGAHDDGRTEVAASTARSPASLVRP